MSLARVTNNMLFNQVFRNLHRNLSQVNTLQGQLSSGKEFSRPSDDPIRFSTALNVRSGLAAQRRYLRNIDRAEANLSMVEAGLTSVSDIIQRARELVVYAGNAAVAPAQMEMIANEIAQLAEEALQIANTQDKSGYIYAGDRTDYQPFRLVTGSSGSYVEYQGDLGERTVEIGRGATIDSSLDGVQAFLLGAYAVTSALRVTDPSSPLAGQLGSATSGDFTINGVSITVNLAADSLEDVSERINDADAGVLAEIDAEGRLILESNRSVAFEAASGTSNLLETLGIFRHATGSVLDAGGIDSSTSLSALGISPEGIRISVNGEAHDIDLSAAATVGDVISTINAAGLGVRAAINQDGTGIDITATSTVESLQIGNVRRVFGSDLGAITRDTALVAAGVTPPSLTGIWISNGADTVQVDLSSAATIGDVLDAINGSNAGVTAEISASGNGIDLLSNSEANNLGPLVIAEVGGGTSAAQLGILGSATQDTASDLGITSTGQLEETSGVNLFQTLMDFEAALRSGQEMTDAIAQALEELDAILEANSSNLATIGARVNRLELAASRGEENELYLTELLSENEDVDIAEVVTRLSMQQTILQASLNATARVLQPTLLDFLG